MTRPFARAAALAGALAVPAALAGCGPDYSPNTYNANAMQQAAKADRGVIIGVRTVKVSASGVIGAATGAAAGGALGSEAPGNGVTSTLGAIGGGLVGGLIGNSVEHAVDDTTVYEYIVEKPNKDSGLGHAEGHDAAAGRAARAGGRRPAAGAHRAGLDREPGAGRVVDAAPLAEARVSRSGRNGRRAAPHRRRPDAGRPGRSDRRNRATAHSGHRLPAPGADPARAGKPRDRRDRGRSSARYSIGRQRGRGAAADARHALSAANWLLTRRSRSGIVTPNKTLRAAGRAPARPMLRSTLRHAHPGGRSNGS